MNKATTKHPIKHIDRVPSPCGGTVANGFDCVRFRVVEIIRCRLGDVCSTAISNCPKVQQCETTIAHVIAVVKGNHHLLPFLLLLLFVCVCVCVCVWC